MLDIKFIRQNPDLVKKSAKDKGVKVDIDRLLEVDKKRREIIQAVEDMRSKKNAASEQIGKTKDEHEKKTIILEMQELDKNNDRLEEDLKNTETEFNELMLQVPNPALDWVPVGKNDEENVEMKKVGKVPKFNFTAKDYMEIAESFDLIDTKRAAKVAGSRFGYLKGDAVLMEFALVKLAFDTLLKENFVPVIPPVMLKSQMARGMGYLEQADREEAYYLPDDDMYLVGTSEQSIGAMHADEILDEKDLPKRYVGFSTCFRREAGSYGKDTKGILRVHQFDKIEMFSFCKPEDSASEHEFLLSMEEKLMQQLELPYRVLKICTGDLGRVAAAKYDIEAWMPSENRYRETHSTSNCLDFQARRLNIRYKKKGGKVEFLHTLNGTAFSQRPILLMLENFQQKDGSVKIPDVLQKYIGKSEIKR